MSTSNSQVPVSRHNQRQNIPSARATPQQQYPQQQQQPQRYSTHVVENNSSTMNYTQGSLSTPPRTPRRVQEKGLDRNATVESAAESGPENQTIPPRSSNRRLKPKNPSITPAAQRSDQYRGTPPIRMQPDSSSKPTPTAIAAYAGPTFHASPAPSALPIPSFYSKSADSPSMQHGPKASLDHDSSSASDSPPSASAALSSDTNLLETLFSSDKGQDSRAQSAQSDVGPFRPPSHTPPNGMVTPQQRPGFHSSHGSASSIFKMEMDGGFKGEIRAGLGVTPYHERINAARSTPTSLSSSPSTTTTSVGPQGGMDQSEAFKSLLFSKDTPTQAPRPRQPLPPFQNAPVPAPFPYQHGPQNGPQNGYQHGYQNNYQNGGYQNVYQNGPHVSSPAAPLRSTLYHSPQQQRYPQPGSGNAYRNSPRNSGLRQEVTSFRSPNSGPRPTAGLTNGMFAPPQVSLNYKENAASPARAQNAAAAQNQAPPQASRAMNQPVNNYNPYNKDMKSMEDNLRDMLKISPTTSTTSGVQPGLVPNATY